MDYRGRNGTCIRRNLLCLQLEPVQREGLTKCMFYFLFLCKLCASGVHLGVVRGVFVPAPSWLTLKDACDSRLLSNVIRVNTCVFRACRTVALHSQCHVTINEVQEAAERGGRGGTGCVGVNACPFANR